jgi:hypothetical protein
MALPILDGNQSATTLSTILSSGQHITAHTVVSLGTQAITDISGAVSGSVVSISNFPATQTIAGTVTADWGRDSHHRSRHSPDRLCHRIHIEQRHHRFSAYHLWHGDGESCASSQRANN